VVLDDYDLEPVGKHFSLDDLLELCALRREQRRHQQRAHYQKQSSEPGTTAISLWHACQQKASMNDAYAKLALQMNETQLSRSEPLAPYTTFRIGGPADLFYSTQTADDLADAVLAARKLSVPYFVLGLGANILVGDKGFRGLVIRNHASHFTFSDNGKLWVESGAVVADLIPEAVERGWSGIEHYVGIPSTIGGAVWQNLHFLEPEPERKRTMFIADAFIRVSCSLKQGERKDGRQGVHAVRVRHQRPSPWKGCRTRCDVSASAW